jgi:hypothetical protein
MKKYIGLAVCVIALLSVLTYQHWRISSLKKDRDVYASNTSELLSDVETYRVNDSLSAARTGVLELKLSEFEKYRADDAALIASLQMKNRDLKSVATMQTSTIDSLRGNVKERIVYVYSTRTDTLRCIDIADKYFELHACIDSYNKYDVRYECRDSLLITETVQYKRFLGFLWKTSKVKNRKIDVVSRNPNTRILGAEYIEIRK